MSFLTAGYSQVASHKENVELTEWTEDTRS